MNGDDCHKDASKAGAPIVPLPPHSDYAPYSGNAALPPPPAYTQPAQPGAQNVQYAEVDMAADDVQYVEADRQNEVNVNVIIVPEGEGLDNPWSKRKANYFKVALVISLITMLQGCVVVQSEYFFRINEVIAWGFFRVCHVEDNDCIFLTFGDSGTVNAGVFFVVGLLMQLISLLIGVGGYRKRSPKFVKNTMIWYLMACLAMGVGMLYMIILIFLDGVEFYFDWAAYMGLLSVASAIITVLLCAKAR